MYTWVEIWEYGHSQARNGIRSFCQQSRLPRRPHSKFDIFSRSTRRARWSRLVFKNSDKHTQASKCGGFPRSEKTCNLETVIQKKRSGLFP